jgi:glutaminyl-peptide cyclotransferase
MQTHINHTQSARAVVTIRASFSLTFILILAFALVGCRQQSTTNTGAGAKPTPTPTQPQTVAFDGERAFEHVRKQVEFGPRPAGSAELAKTREYMIGELKSYGLNVTTDEWTAQTPVGPRKMVNVMVDIPGESQEMILLASHYDTKLYKKFHFVGANDGGSNTGVLLELARVLASRQQKPHFTYHLVFFDGEEAFCENWDDCMTPTGPDNTYGSRRHVEQLMEKGELKRLRAMILLDMVGYKELKLGRDDLSTRWLIDLVWQMAREMGFGAQFVDEPEMVGDDDHGPYLKVGVDALDIIQLNEYPYWHKPEDTLDKISARSLKIVGDVVLASLPRIEERLKSRPAS